MMKDQLIEQLAGELYTKRWGAAAPRPWEDTAEDIREIWREQIRTFYPLIVAFVAEWITHHNDNRTTKSPLAPSARAYLVSLWREDMS